MSVTADQLRVYRGPELAAYGFGDGHPFNNRRHGAFEDLFRQRGHPARCVLLRPVMADREDLLRFHTGTHVDRVKALSAAGIGAFDQGDTPVVPGIHEAACVVVGSVLDAAQRMVAGEFRRAFVPIAGLHHARRDAAAGFCVYNDCGVAIEWLLADGGLSRVAYVDIDVHHGDGVYYAFESDPRLVFVDFHQDGRTLYPGTGAVTETGLGDARGLKLNVPLPPGAGDELLKKCWSSAESLLERHAPELILLQCGADSLAGDPLAALNYSASAHGHVAARLRALAERLGHGRVLATGGGGYDLGNVAQAWNAVVEALL